MSYIGIMSGLNIFHGEGKEIVDCQVWYYGTILPEITGWVVCFF